MTHTHKKKQIFSAHCLGTDCTSTAFKYLWEKTSSAQTAFALPMCEGREPGTVALLVTCRGIRSWGVLQPLGWDRLNYKGPGALWTCGSCCSLVGGQEGAGCPPCITSPASWMTSGTGGVNNCAPRSGVLGWENDLVQLLCFSWRFFFLPHLHYKEGAVLSTCLLRPYQARLVPASAVMFPARYLTEMMSPNIQGMHSNAWNTTICTVTKDILPPCGLHRWVYLVAASRVPTMRAGRSTRWNRSFTSPCAGQGDAGQHLGLRVVTQVMPVVLAALVWGFSSDSRTRCYLPRISCRDL